MKKQGGSSRPVASSTNTPHTPKRPRRKADAPEPGRFTPRRPREQAAKQKQTDLRLTIATRMKEETVYCTNEDFMEHYLPPIPDTVSVEAIVEGLEQGTYLQKSAAHAQDLLGDFSVKPSELKEKKGTRTNEKAIFAPLEDVTNAIRESAGASKNAFHMRMLPHAEFESKDIPGCTVKIDACTTANDKAAGTLTFTDIVVPLEFKVHNTEGEKQKNRAQLVSTIVHIMNDDIRRNFIFGITIEDDYVSMWYFSRTHSVKATSFSYVKNPEKLVHVLAALSCATEEQLGFDPRITLLSDKSYLYAFPVTLDDDATTISYVGENFGNPVSPCTTLMPRTLYFKTTAAICKAHTLRIAGRTTRVFKGKQVVSKEDPTPRPGAVEVVVKDVWINAKSPTEIEIQRDLFEDIEKLAAAPEDSWKLHPLLEDFDEADKAAFWSWLPNERYKNLFLCAARESVGEASKPVHPEAWHSDEIFIDLELIEEGSGISGSIGTGSIPATGSEGPSPLREFSSKKRCFFLFQDVCTRVSALPTLGEAIDVLRQTHLALTLMFCAGWVHRDISSGNVLAVKKDGVAVWQAKLADLEYARKFPSDDAGSTDPKTGTSYFMACEIQTSLSLFQSPEKVEDPFSHWAVNANVEKVHRGTDWIFVKKHTYAHDLESLWWLILWIITNLLGYRDSYNAARVYFQKNNHSRRRLLLTNGATLVLHPNLNGFAEPLNRVRATLAHGYLRRDPRTALANLSTYKGACASYLDLFNAIQGGKDIWGSMALHPPPSRNRAADVSSANGAHASGVTRSDSKKRKLEQDGQVHEQAVHEPLRRSTRLTTKSAAPKVDGPGPFKKARY